jgi:hypothetical protein
MAKRSKTLPARRSPDQREESLFLRSAESLGRLIGALQRQLEGAKKQLSGTDNGNGAVRRTGRRPVKRAAAGARASARSNAAESAPARKTNTRSKSGRSR